jgi:RimJ/RimL family protein N-acetyltransferase
VNLHPIPNPPSAFARLAELPPLALEIFQHTASFWASPHYVFPWVSYVGELHGELVAYGAFKSSPSAGRVEIAYATFPGREGKGIATNMARRLVTIARAADPAMVILAQTLREPGASTRILEKLGFVRSGDVLHPEDGWVWQWELAPER